LSVKLQTTPLLENGANPSYKKFSIAVGSIRPTHKLLSVDVSVIAV